MHTLNTIVPVFAVIFLGMIIRRRGYLQQAFLGPANHLVYYIAIPAMIFRATARGSLQQQFHGAVLGGVLLAPCVVVVLAWWVARLLRIDRPRIGTCVQSTFHGNLGYIGLAVVYYALGDEALVQASILAGFLMILQNFLAVSILQIYGGDAPAGQKATAVAMRIVGNPVIVSAFLGILVSALGIPIPTVLGRSLDIVSGMALPLALLIIGASLSFGMFRPLARCLVPIAVLKLLVLPGIGMALFTLLKVDPARYVSGIILLASPSATLTYVMAKEMGGDPDLAAAAISGTTLVSAMTYALWLHAAV